MAAGDPASIFRPDTHPAWIEAIHVVAFSFFQHNNLVMARHNSLAEAYLINQSVNTQIPATPARCWIENIPR